MVKVTSMLIQPLLLLLIVVAMFCGFALQNLETPNFSGSLLLFLFAFFSILLYMTINMLLSKIIELKKQLS